MDDTTHSIIDRDITLLGCVERFASTHAGIVVFVDERRRFVGLLTAGDAFRLLARGVGLNEAVLSYVNTHAVTVTSGVTNPEILRLMTIRGLGCIPVLHADGTVERIVTQGELLKENILRNRAIVMAGGDGTRLRPLTDTVPKALVEVNGKPLLALVIERLRDFGILDIILSVRYQADAIRAVFGDGSAWHVNITYVEEQEPLGTCGVLGLIQETWADPFFVLNCDVLSDIDLVSMAKFHALNRSELTVAVTDHEIEVPFGVVEVDHERVRRLSEKPKLKFYVNAGIYLLNPAVKDMVPRGHRLDMTELIGELLNRNATVCSYRLRSLWLDVGDSENLRRAHALQLE
jgi:dTDP-glucose pyrophosphorylase